MKKKLLLSAILVPFAIAACGEKPATDEVDAIDDDHVDATEHTTEAADDATEEAEERIDHAIDEVEETVEAAEGAVLEAIEQAREATENE